jgi:hypothetical protein
MNKEKSIVVLNNLIEITTQKRMEIYKTAKKVQKKKNDLKDLSSEFPKYQYNIQIRTY